MSIKEKTEVKVEKEIDLKDKIISSKKELFSLRIKHSNGELKDCSKMKKLKKEIARLFTKLNLKK